MKIDFSHLDPARLVDTAAPNDVVDAVGRIDASMQFEVEALDYVHQHWVLRALRERTDADHLQRLRTLADHLRLAAGTNEDVLDGFDPPFAKQWRALAALVDHRIELTETQDVDEALQREHVRTILEVIGKHGSLASQDQLLAHLGRRQIAMGKANLSRILKLLEATELIAREKIGQRNAIVPGINMPIELRPTITAPSALAARPHAAHAPRRRLRGLFTDSSR